MARRRKPSQAEVLRLGPETAGIKAQVKPRAWRKFVKSAHKRGFTVAGALSNAPDPLKERTRSSLVAEANKTVAAAYAPARAELSQRESRINALDGKRQADEARYREWLTTKTNDIQSKARAADATLTETQRQLAIDTKNAYDEAQKQALEAAGQTAGNVSDPSKSTSLDFSVESATAQNLVNNARQQTADLVGTGEQAMQMASQSNIAMSAAAEAKRQSDTWSALSDVSDERTKLVLQQGADAAEQVANLLAGETNKAQSNREFGAAAEKLGLDQDKFSLDLRDANDKRKNADDEFKAKYGVTRAHYDRMTPAQRLVWKKKWARAGMAPPKADQGEEHFGYSQKAWDKMTIAQRLKAKRQWESDGKGDTPDGASDGQIKTSQTKVETVSTALAALQHLHAVSKHPAGTFRTRLLSDGFSNIVIDLAEDLRTHDGRFSPAGRRKARAIGILNPGNVRL